MVAFRIATVLAAAFAIVALAAPTGGQAPRPAFLVTEVLVNSGQGRSDSAFEWFELWSGSDTAASLAGWSVEDNNARSALPDVEVPPNAFVVVVPSREAAEAVSVAAGAGVLFALLEKGRIGNGLANTGDRLILRDPSGGAVDGFSWGADRSLRDLTAPAAGETLSRADPEAPFLVGPPNPGAWAPPPPEVPASAVELVISEIYANAGRAAADARYEWIEIFNPSDEPVDLRG